MRSILTALVILGVLVGCVAVVYGIVTRREVVVQPIAFNHALDLDQAGVQCIECHTSAGTQVYAGIPRKELCFDCHDIDEEADDASPEKAKLFAFDEVDHDIPWRRVALTRPDVFFSHRRQHSLRSS